jgi:flagellar protein FliO/FliZ
MNSALTPLLWFAAVIALIPVALWLLKRTPVGAAASAGPMRTISTLPLSAQQRLVTVEVGSGEDRTWLVLGVTPQSIQTLHAMAPQLGQPVPTATAATPQNAFNQLLQRLRQDGGDSHGR